ncbi:MAG TPA: lactonase family protein [Kofleriaceae bacterium]
MRGLWLAVLFATACEGTAPVGGDANGGGDGGDGSMMIDASTQPTRFVAYISGGANIDWYDVNKMTGALTPISSIAAFRTGANFLAFHGDYLYAVTSGNRVGAYSIDPATASLTFINDVASAGTGPAHVSVDGTGKYVFTANYGSGHIGVFAVQASGGLAAASQTILAGANAHQIDADPSNKFVVVPCLGDDKVAQYVFNATTGMLTANAVPQVDTANGAGPRHISFAPDGKRAFLINELNSTLSPMSFDDVMGRLTAIHTVSTRASGAMGTNTTAEVVVHPNGKFVYGSNRGDNNIVVFSIDAGTGMVTVVEHESTQGMTPRNFTIDPTGTLLYAANQNSNSVVPFAIDVNTGRLSPTASPITVPTPQFVGIVALPL